jgi:transcriptional regulator with XRE-family HTH domain
MKPETQHVIQILRTAMRVLGLTNAEIERRLGVSGGYLTRLFGGVMELRFEHIVDISRAMGLEPEEVLQLAFPQPRNPPTEAALRLRETLLPILPQPPAAPPTPPPHPEDDADLSASLDQELERRIQRILLRVLGNLGKSVGGGE